MKTQQPNNDLFQQIAEAVKPKQIDPIQSEAQQIRESFYRLLGKQQSIINDLQKEGGIK
jgi:hypothetical protein